jgi:phosphopantetheine adenylyltransferase
MINELKELLKQAKKEKAEALKPYNERIRNLTGAIRNLEKFDNTSLEINNNPHAQVIEVPKPEEGANYAN